MSFEEWLVSRQKKQEKTQVKALEAIEKFSALINEFYGKITGEWLKEAIEKGQIVFGRTATSITEELLGTYTADALWIEIAGERLSVVPVGTYLIGTDARFDMSYRGVEYMIVHDMEKGGWLLINRSNRVQRKRIDEAVFQGLIMDMMK